MRFAEQRAKAAQVKAEKTQETTRCSSYPEHGETTLWGQSPSQAAELLYIEDKKSCLKKHSI